MSNVLITELTQATTITTSDLFVMSQSNEAKKGLGSLMINYFAQQLDGHGGISSIVKTATAGNIDTYTITYGDTTTTTFEVTNGLNGRGILNAQVDPVTNKLEITYTDSTSYESESLKGDTGDMPVISVAGTSLPSSATPTVTKSGTDENPLITFGIPVYSYVDDGDGNITVT